MEPQLWVVLTAIGTPFLAAALVPLFYRLLGEAVAYVGAAVAVVSFGLVASQLGAQGTVAATWIPSLGVAARFTVDGWALLFALLASGIGALIFLYSAGYMHGEANLPRFYAALLAFMGSILGVAFAADIVVLFLFWELTSVASFVLIGYHTDESGSRYAARMAMLVTVGGGLCLLAGLLMLSIASEAVLGSQTFDLATILANDEAIRAALEERGLFVPALLLIAVAAGAKSAQVPLHFWLPNAMVAPTPVSAFLHSATMVKVGVYAIGRLRQLFLGEAWMLVFTTVGLVTMLVGAMLAVRAMDIKELLAYSTASHLGLMVAGFGFLSHYGAEAGVFHLLNHALFKAALFLVAGIVVHQVGTKRLDELGGLRRDLPLTALLTVVAALSMAGIPPFNGFYSKELLFEAAWTTAIDGGGLAWLYPAVALLASIFTVLYSLRFLAMFFGEHPSTITNVPRPSAALLVPPAALVGIAAVVSVSPQLAIDLIVQDAAAVTAVEPLEVHAALPTELTGPVAMSIVTVVSGVAAFPFGDRIRRGVEALVAAGSALQPSALYARSLTGIESVSVRFGRFVHNGLIRTYVQWVLGATCALTLVGFVAASVPVPAVSGPEAPAAMVLVLGVAVVAAFRITTADSHVTGVLTLGILGFMVAIFYILASAPDLALTQLVVETLILLIFLLVIEEVPAFYSEIEMSVAVRDAAFSIFVGATAFLSVLVAAPASETPLSETARYYVDHAVEGGGGTNVVNVILTDFRAFDTLGELVVVVLAALSVLVLIRMRSHGEEQRPDGDRGGEDRDGPDQRDDQRGQRDDRNAWGDGR